jgi:hypothetical protein
MAVLAKGTKILWGDGGAGAVKATLSHGSSAANLTLTAKAAGTGGNSITLTIVNPGGTAALSVSVSTNAITVNAQTSSGSIVSTANDIIAAIFASAAASALVVPSSTGAGTGVVAALSSTALSGGANSAEVFHDLPNIGDITLNPGEYPREDVSSHSSPGPNPEMINSAFTSEASASFTINYEPGDNGHDALEADFDSNTTRNAKLVPPVGSGLPTRTFQAQVSSMPEAYPVRGVMTRAVSLSITSAIVKA